MASDDPVASAATVEGHADALTIRDRRMAGKCICSSGDHGHDRWLCPGDAITVAAAPSSHRCVRCWSIEGERRARADMANYGTLL